MLEQLAKRDKDWRDIAFRICKDKSLADDLVQEMYLKMYNVEKQINDFYVIIVIRNCFLDYLKQSQKTISLDGFDFPDKKTKFELNDEEKKLFDNLTWWEKEIIEMTYDKSFHEIQRELGINFQFSRRVLIKAKNKWQDQKNNTKA